MPSPRLTDLTNSWYLSLNSDSKSHSTIRSYLDSVNSLVRYLEGQGAPIEIDAVEPEHVRGFLVAERTRTSDGNAAKHWRNLSVFFTWLTTEGECAVNPMNRVARPKVTLKIKTYLTEAELRRLLKTCEGGSDFESRRDAAILRVFMDTGIRVSGLADIRVSDVNLIDRRIRIILKGGDEHLIPLGHKAALAVDRYLRARARHHHADSPWLWLGLRGTTVNRMTRSGVQGVVKRRATQAGLTDVTPHRLRRSWVHHYLAGGGQIDQAAAIAGWKSPSMVFLYAGDLAAERARQAHDRLSPGDRL